jgi:hypothetical protein
MVLKKEGEFLLIKDTDDTRPRLRFLWHNGSLQIDIAQHFIMSNVINRLGLQLRDDEKQAILDFIQKGG